MSAMKHMDTTDVDWMLCLQQSIVYTEQYSSLNKILKERWKTNPICLGSQAIENSDPHSTSHAKTDDKYAVFILQLKCRNDRMNIFLKWDYVANCLKTPYIICFMY